MLNWPNRVGRLHVPPAGVPPGLPLERHCCLMQYETQLRRRNDGVLDAETPPAFSHMAGIIAAQHKDRLDDNAMAGQFRAN